MSVEKKKVCLDPGHGVETAGKRSPDGSYREYEFALDMAYRIKPILERHGVEVSMTRLDEHDVSLAQRVKVANNIPGLDLFVSLHSNAAGNGARWMSARGLLVYVYASDSRSTAAGQKILDYQAQVGVMVRNGGRPNDGSKLYVVRKTNATAVLVEHLFHDNLEDTALLKDSSYRQRMAVADAKGILDYLGITWVEESEREEEETMDVNRFKELWNEMRKDLQDNDSGEWSEKACQWAVSTGLVSGSGNQDNGEPNYMWEDILTREQLVTVLYRFAKMMGKV